MIPIAPICWGCRHLRDGDETCDAFPTGIPDAILGNETDHRLPVKGDHDIRFDPLSPEAADWAEHVFGPAPVAVGEYAMAGVTEYAYSPNQPRKSDGKFGTGGGLKGGSSGSTDNGGPGAAGITVAGLKGTAAIADHFASESPQAHPTWEQKKVTGQRLKGEAMKQVGADLDAQFDAERLTQAADGIGSWSKRGETPGERVADSVMSSWADQAYDEQEWSSTAIQLAVAREFKTGVTRDISGAIKADLDTVANWPSTHGYDMPVLQAAVRSMHTHTQEQLDALGVGPTVALVRGTGTTHRGQTDITMHPASSWTTDTHVADSFSGGSDSGDGSRLSMTVPRSRILSMSGHGVGSYEESEVVVLRAAGDQALAVRPEGLLR